VTAPTIANLLLGTKSMNNGTLAQYLSGDIAEMMVYDAALTNSELDRLGYIYICIYVYIHTHYVMRRSRTWLEKLGYICLGARQAGVHMYVLCMYVCIHTHTHIHTHTCECVCVCVYVCIYIYIY